MANHNNSSLYCGDRGKYYFNEDKLGDKRIRLYIQFIKNIIDLDKIDKTNFKYLDVGCGSGKVLLFFKSMGFNKLYGIDLSLKSEARLKDNIYFYVEDINTIDLSKKFRIQFDLISCNEVLEHLYDPKKKIDEIIRLTKPNGLIFFSLPLDLNISTRLKLLFFGINIHHPFNVGTHIKFFKPNQIINHFKSRTNLDLVSVKYLGLGYGNYDNVFPPFKLLAKLFPNLFASGIFVMLRRK